MADIITAKSGAEHSLMPPFTGLILAQGGSRRMGQDKATLELNGKSFLNVAADLLAKANVEPVYINNHENMADLIADIGPLGGIYTAFETQKATNHWVMVPVDMPLLTADLLQMLMDGLQDADMARFDGEMFPLVVKSSPAVQQHLAALANDQTRTYSMRQFMKPFNIRCLPKPNGSETAFTNVNSPEEFAALCI